MCFERVAASDQKANVLSDQPSTEFQERDPNVTVDLAGLHETITTNINPS